MEIKVTIAADLYDIKRLFCCLIMSSHHKITNRKKKPLCTSLSNPGKNKGSCVILSPILMEHIIKINKAHKTVGL